MVRSSFKDLEQHSSWMRCGNRSSLPFLEGSQGPLANPNGIGFVPGSSLQAATNSMIFTNDAPTFFMFVWRRRFSFQSWPMRSRRCEVSPGRA
tara:strand:+ start:268 stop:546 length:279 start_codon:yes stop_codon:yes gene_type:complete